VQILLGIYPFAPFGAIALVRPRLPSWIDVLEIERMRVGEATISLRFERGGDGTTGYRITDQEGSLRVLDAPPPQVAGDASAVERLESILLDHFPGRRGRIIRIALGIEGEHLAARVRQGEPPRATRR
jgi:hypothetical protein